MVRYAAIAAFLLAALAAAPSVADVTGPASVIDGDTLVIAGERIRLEGIDAPNCTRTAPPSARNGHAVGPRRNG